MLAEAQPGGSIWGKCPPKFFQQCFLDCYYLILSVLVQNTGSRSITIQNFWIVMDNPIYCENLCCTIEMHKYAPFHRHKIKIFPGYWLNEVPRLTPDFVRTPSAPLIVHLLGDFFIYTCLDISCKNALSAFHDESMTQCTKNLFLIIKMCWYHWIYIAPNVT